DGRPASSHPSAQDADKMCRGRCPLGAHRRRLQQRIQCGFAARPLRSGAAHMVMRGRYPPQTEPLVVERFSRGGGQGCPDMPAVFAEVIAMIDQEAEAAMVDVHRDMSADAAEAV